MDSVKQKDSQFNEEVFTIFVSFPDSAGGVYSHSRKYTYLSWTPISKGEQVVVNTPHGLKVVTVFSYARGLKPMKDVKYRWVECIVGQEFLPKTAHLKHVPNYAYDK